MNLFYTKLFIVELPLTFINIHIYAFHQIISKFEIYSHRFSRRLYRKICLIKLFYKSFRKLILENFYAKLYKSSPFCFYNQSNIVFPWKKYLDSRCSAMYWPVAMRTPYKEKIISLLELKMMLKATEISNCHIMWMLMEVTISL